MKEYILAFEYNSKNFMDLNKIIRFKNNLKTLKDEDIIVKLIFYGEASDEELATFMGYFNDLVGEKLCNIAISFKSKEIVFENGINNKSIKASVKNAKEIKNKKFIGLVKEYYPDVLAEDIKTLPTKNWDSIILDLKGV
jgi:hypothetical protein